MNITFSPDEIPEDLLEFFEPDVEDKSDVWRVTTKAFRLAHFATFPEALIEPCVLAGSRVGDVVLDPFNGAGTTGVVAKKHGRSYIGFELNPDYLEMARERIEKTQEQIALPV